MAIREVSRDKAKKAIETFLSGKEPLVQISRPNPEIRDAVEESLLGQFSPVRQGVRDLYLLSQLVCYADIKELDFIFQEMDLSTRNAFTFYNAPQKNGQEVRGIKKRLGRWIDRIMYEHAINELYDGLQDTDSPFHELRNMLAVNALQFLDRTGIPIEPYVSEQLRKAS